MTWRAPCVLGSTHHLEPLGLRVLGPQLIGAGHRLRALRARPPSVVNLVRRPHHERGDLRGVGKRDHGLPADEAGRLALRVAVAVQQLPRGVDLVGLGPVMREDTDHRDLLKAFPAMIASVPSMQNAGGAVRLDSIAKVIRSKNAGPCLLTLDVMLPDEESYAYVAARVGALRRQVGRRYGRR